MLAQHTVFSLQVISISFILGERQVKIIDRMKRKKIEGVKDKRERGREIRGLRKNWREKKREGERDKDLKEKKDRKEKGGDSAI